MTTSYDYKINKRVNFQLGTCGNYVVYFLDYEWDDKPLPDCKIVRAKTYRSVTKSSLNRISRVINDAINNRVGKLELWVTSLGWSYNDFGTEVLE